jgi:hypothetical protein
MLIGGGRLEWQFMSRGIPFPLHMILNNIFPPCLSLTKQKLCYFDILSSIFFYVVQMTILHIPWITFCRRFDAGSHSSSPLGPQGPQEGYEEHVPGSSLQLSRKADRMEVLRLSLQCVSLSLNTFCFYP